jgi:hypothetical protein
VAGNVDATVGDFFEGYQPAPVGAIFNDLDLYTSTRNSLKLLDNNPEFFLPRLLFYFDDVVGTELEMYSECAMANFWRSRYSIVLTNDPRQQEPESPCPH